MKNVISLLQSFVPVERCVDVTMGKFERWDNKRRERAHGSPINTKTDTSARRTRLCAFFSRAFYYFHREPVQAREQRTRHLSIIEQRLLNELSRGILHADCYYTTSRPDLSEPCDNEKKRRTTYNEEVLIESRYGSAIGSARKSRLLVTLVMYPVTRSR